MNVFSIKNIRNLILLTLAGFSIILLILYLLSSSNHVYVPESLCKAIEDKLETHVSVEGYEVNRTDYFPFFLVSVNQLFIDGSHFGINKKRLLEIDQLDMRIHAWDMLRSAFHAHDIHLKNASIKFYKDSLGESNMEFLKKLSSNKTKEKKIETSSKKNKATFNFDQIKLENVYAEFTNVFKNQSFRTTFKKGILRTKKISGGHKITLNADCFFEGLYFKIDKGGYLVDTHAELNVYINAIGDSISFNQSNIIVGTDTLSIDGHFFKNKGKSLALDISSKGILIGDASALLTEKLQETLNQIHIDQPIKADFSLRTGTEPNSINVDFETENANLNFNDLSVSNMILKGSFNNRCRPLRLPKSKQGCLRVDRLDGELLGQHKVIAQGVIHDLKELSDVEIKGSVSAQLKKLNDKIDKKSNLKINNGIADIDFDYRGNFKSLIQNKNYHQKRLKVRMGFDDVNFVLGEMTFDDFGGALNFDREFDLNLNNITSIINETPLAINGTLDNFIGLLEKNKFKTDTKLSVRIADLDLDKILAQPSDNEGGTLSEKLRAILKPIKEKLNADIALSIDTIRFNDKVASSVFVDVDLSDEKATDLALKNIVATIESNLVVDGDLLLYNLETYPFLDANIHVKSPANTLAKFQNSNKFSVTNGKVEIDTKAHLNLDDLNDADHILEHISFDNQIKLEDVTFSDHANDLDIDELNCLIDLNNDTLTISGLDLNYNEETDLDLQGQIIDYLPLVMGKSHPVQIDLRLSVPKLNFQKLTKKSKRIPSLKTENKRAIATIQPRSMVVKLNKIFDKVSGRVAVQIDTLEHEDYPTEQISFTTILEDSCSTNTEEIHCIEIENFNASIFGDIPINLEAKLINLDDPKLEFSFDGDMSIKELNRILYNKKFISRDGDIKLQLSYGMKLSDTLTVKNYLHNADLSGNLFFNKVHLDHLENGYTFHDINGPIYFDNEKIQVKDISLLFNQNEIVLNGDSPDLLPFLYDEGYERFHFNASLSSPKIVLDNFINKDKKVKPKESVKTRIDKLLKIMSFSFATDIDELVYESFVAYDFNGQTHFDKNEIGLDQCSMSIADGTFNVHGKVTDIEQEESKFDMDLHFDHVDAHEIFKSFSNFGQNELTSKNVLGTIKADVDISANIDKEFRLIPESAKGTIALKAFDGELIEFPTLKSLSGFLFKRRHLEDIYFDTIHTTFHLDNLDLYIDHFDIRSTAADLSVEGIYTFSDEDRTHLHLEIPIGTLFKRHIPKRLIKSHKKRRKGAPILVEAREKNKKLEFKINLFKHHEIE